MKYDITQHSKHANTIRNEKLTPAERSNIAYIAAKARWEKNNQREELLKQREAHVCDYSCRCVNCGARIVKHNKYSECQSPVCKIKGEL